MEGRKTCVRFVREKGFWFSEKDAQRRPPRARSRRSFPRGRGPARARGSGSFASRESRVGAGWRESAPQSKQRDYSIPEHTLRVRRTRRAAPHLRRIILGEVEERGSTLREKLTPPAAALLHELHTGLPDSAQSAMARLMGGAHTRDSIRPDSAMVLAQAR